MQRPIYTQASKKVIFNDLCFVCVNAKVTLFQKTARYSRTIGLGMTWLIGFSCTLRVLSFIWSTKHGQTMWFWQQRNHQHKKTLRWTWKKYMTWCAPTLFQKISNPSPTTVFVTWKVVGFIGFLLSFTALQAVSMGRLTRHWVNGIMVQMLGTRPDAFPHPSRLDRMEERPTSRSMCGLCWWGKGRKWISRINA